MAAEANNSIASQFFSPWQPAPAFAEPPAELETAKRIQTTVEYAKRNGRRFVDMIKSKQQDNAQYAFLFGGVGSAYYEWLLYSTLFNLQPERPLPEHAADAAAPQQPGQEAAAAEQQLQQQIAALPAEVASGFTQVLNALNGSKDSIKASQQWFMACAQCCVGMAAMMAQHIRQLTSHDRQLHVIYLANDILLKSHSQRPAGATEQQDAVAMALAGVLGGMLRSTVATAGPAGSDVRAQLDRMLAFWGQKAALTAATLERLRAEMLAPATPPNGAADAAASPPPWQAPSPVPAPAAPAPWTSAAAAAPPQMQPPPPHLPPPYPGAAPPPPWSAGALPDRPPWAAAAAPEVGAAVPEAAGGGYGHAPGAYLPMAAPPPLPPGGYPPPGTPEQHPVYPHPHHPAPAPSALEAALAAPPPPPTFNDSSRPPDKPSAASLSFPAGLIPAMVQYKLRTHEPYTPLSARDIQDTPPPRPPKMDEYLSSRLNRFYSELDSWRMGTTRAAFEDNRRRAERRKAKGEADDEEMGGRRRRPGRSREERDKDTGTFADGSVGRGSGSQYAGLGMHSKSAAVRRPEPEEPSDEFESFRKHRAGVYRTTMQSKSAAAQAARMAAPP